MFNVESVLKDALKQVLELNSLDGLDGNLRFREDLDFDSGMFIELLMTIEEFSGDLKLDPVKLKQEDFETIGTLISYLETLVKKSTV